MTRKLIATIAAAAIALSGFAATPAAALDDREVIKLLLGAAAVGVLVNELNKKNKKEIAADNNAYRNRNVYRYDDNRYDGNRYDGNRHDNDSRRGHGSRNRVIPSSCVFDIRTRNGMRGVVSERCVEKSDFRGNLPKSCKFELRRDGRKQTVYGANCLRDRGIRVASARR